MKTFLFILITTMYIGSTVFSQTQKGLDIDGEAPGDYSGLRISMPDANTVAIGADGNDGNGSDAGHVRIYNWIGSAWTQKGGDIDGEAAFDESGRSVSMPDPNTVAIGAPGNDGGGNAAGHVRIYTWNGSAWTQKGIDIDGEAAGDRSGISVSMPDANTVAIGAHLNDGNGNNAGHVRIYTWNGSAWTQKGGDVDGEAGSDLSGYSVSMPDANTVAIGAYANNGNGSQAGHTRIYTWNGNAWTQKGIDIDGEAAGDRSGISVSMPDANTVAIGAYMNDGNGSYAGHVRIYSWNGTAWVQKGADMDGEAANDVSGYSVSMPDANTVAIGASQNDGNGNNAGHVRIYTWNGSAWIQNGIDIDGEAADDFSGYSVSMPDFNTVAIGAYANSGNGFESGHVRVYSLSPCTPNTGTDVQTACNTFTWIDGNTYTASNNSATYTLLDGAGCDSIVTLDLTINLPTSGTDVQTACGSYTWIDGNTYSASTNTPTYTETSVLTGCDSIVTLDLTIISPSTGVDVQTSCSNFTWIDGNTYASSTNSPTYTISNGAASGCDSIVTLDLTILPPVLGTDIQTSCGSFTWIDGNTYGSSTNSPTFTISNGAVNGCDSTVTLDLTITSPSTGVDAQTSCENYTWIDGNTYAASTNTPTYTIVGGGTNGCDSVVTLDLTINPLPDNNVTQTGTLLEADQTGAAYQWLDCDDNYSTINTETNQAYTPAVSGNYAVEITLNGCTDTSSRYLVDYSGVTELEDQVISIHPNPTSNILFISGLDQVSGVQKMEILSVTGKVVARMEGLNEQIDVSKFSNGIYFLNIQHKTGVESIRFVKQ